MRQVPIGATDAVLLVVSNQIPGGCREDVCLTRRRLEAGIGHEMQRGLLGRGFGDGPDKAFWQKPEDLVYLLQCVRICFDLLLLRALVAEELLDASLLLGLGLLAAILDQDALEVPLLGGSERSTRSGRSGSRRVQPRRLAGRFAAGSVRSPTRAVGRGRR
jgi:hypothetical protein